jgi:hypothetical protein
VPGLNEGKRLFVRGPNIMAGYLRADQPGVVVPPDGGWHDTGDIVTIEDGYVIIRGRAKRFAKLGGEMVSLAAIEGLVAGLWRDAQHVVLNLPDPRKGEQLLLVRKRPTRQGATRLPQGRLSGCGCEDGAVVPVIPVSRPAGNLLESWPGAPSLSSAFRAWREYRGSFAHAFRKSERP